MPEQVFGRATGATEKERRLLSLIRLMTSLRGGGLTKGKKVVRGEEQTRDETFEEKKGSRVKGRASAERGWPRP